MPAGVSMSEWSMAVSRSAAARDQQFPRTEPDALAGGFRPGTNSSREQNGRGNREGPRGLVAVRPVRGGHKHERPRRLEGRRGRFM